MPGIGSDPNGKVERWEWIFLWIWGGLTVIGIIILWILT